MKHEEVYDTTKQDEEKMKSKNEDLPYVQERSRV